MGRSLATQSGPQTGSMGCFSVLGVVRNAGSQAHPHLLNLNLYFNKPPGCLICTLKVEKRLSWDLEA